MVRAPCCEKIGLKKGPWTCEEDRILISYIQKYGHGNWRALPKQAGLLRCGKSCRLRWMNYLRPDIKRGNFTEKEEETIIKLHQMLGNRWSAIAAKLPRRTDNEIKNVWHTHLKKKLLRTNQPNSGTKKSSLKPATKRTILSDSSPITQPEFAASAIMENSTNSASTSSSDLSSINFEENKKIKNEYLEDSFQETVPQIDESFWTEAATMDYENCSTNLASNSVTISNEYQFNSMESFQNGYGFGSKLDDDGMDFWYNLFIRAEDSLGLPEL